MISPVVALFVVTLLLSPGSSKAARIYSLVNYPDLQNGHTLKGTITTTDDAPEDGLLDVAEILDWEWEVRDDVLEIIAIGQMDPTFPHSSSLTEVVGIEIDLQGIFFSHELGQIFKLQINTNVDSRGYNTRRLAWLSGFPDFSSLYALSGITGGDILTGAWVTELPDNQRRWQIATSVPEPSGLILLCCVSVFATAMLRRRKELDPMPACS